jgi:hypothetical protein
MGGHEWIGVDRGARRAIMLRMTMGMRGRKRTHARHATPRLAHVGAAERFGNLAMDEYLVPFKRLSGLVRVEASDGCAREQPWKFLCLAYLSCPTPFRG